MDSRPSCPILQGPYWLWIQAPKLYPSPKLLQPTKWLYYPNLNLISTAYNIKVYGSLTSVISGEMDKLGFDRN
ncbi:hypothetical protein CFP56_037490 [Quercus suber]|uniref:Uncharacterized protein n=1 Tax=Quercus suber TaxID=58331 RepID=A0AAW0J4Z4_QUESU